MKVRVFGPVAGYGPGEHPNRVMTSWAPNEIVEVDDSDEAAVTFYRRWIDRGAAEQVNDDSSPGPVPQRRAEQAPAPREPTTPNPGLPEKQPRSTRAEDRQAVQRTGGEQVRPGRAKPGSRTGPGDPGGG